MLLDRGKKRYNRADARFVHKHLLKIVFSLFIVVCLFLIVNHLKKATYFPIQEVKIIGAQHIDHDEIQHLVAPLVSKGFFAVDVGEIKDRISQTPWVSRLAVQRVWPNQVVVKITEKIPMARWNENSLVGSQGELFHPLAATFPSDLPRFVGPEGNQVQMLTYYRKINNLLSPLHFKILSLEFTPYASWRIIFDNGIKLTAGHKDIMARLDQFVKLYPRVVGNRVDRVEYIDLRYSNGMAVKWKTVT